MQKLLTIIRNAIGYLSGLKALNDRLQEELEKTNIKNSEQATYIEELRQKVADDAVNDQELQEAATAARAAADEALERQRQLQAEIDEATTAGQELAQLINDHPETPNVTEDFKPA